MAEDDCHERMDLARMLLGDGAAVLGYVNSNPEYSRYQDAYGDVDDTGGIEGTGILTPVTEAYFGTEAQRATTGYKGPDIPAHLFKHPMGGGPGFLSGAMSPGAPATETFVDGLTSIFQSENGTTTAMNVLIETCQDLITGIEADAPVEMGELRECWEAEVWGI